MIGYKPGDLVRTISPLTLKYCVLLKQEEDPVYWKVKASTPYPQLTTMNRLYFSYVVDPGTIEYALNYPDLTQQNNFTPG